MTYYLKMLIGSNRLNKELEGKVMKVNKAPEKIYLSQERDEDGCYIDLVWNRHPIKGKNVENIEYTRTDALIEKAWDWVEDNLLSSNQQDKSLLYYEQFKNFIKGE